MKIGLLEHDIPWLHFGIQVVVLTTTIIYFARERDEIWEFKDEDQIKWNLGKLEGGKGFIAPVRYFIMAFSSSAFLCLTATYCIGQISCVVLVALITAFACHVGVLQRPTILNAGYMIAAVLFYSFNSFEWWILLVLYIQFVFAVQYCVQFFNFNQDDSYAQLFGFKHWDLQWYEGDSLEDSTSQWILLPDLLVLILASIQYHFFQKKLKIVNQKGMPSILCILSQISHNNRMRKFALYSKFNCLAVAQNLCKSFLETLPELSISTVSLYPYILSTLLCFFGLHLMLCRRHSLTPPFLVCFSGLFPSIRCKTEDTWQAESFPLARMPVHRVKMINHRLCNQPPAL